MLGAHVNTDMAARTSARVSKALARECLQGYASSACLRVRRHDWLCKAFRQPR